MRLRQPLNGFKLARGHWIFHIAFMVGSFIAIEIDPKKSIFFDENVRKDI